MKKKKDKVVLVTEDTKKGKVAEADKAIVEAAATGVGLIQITSAEQLKELAEKAGRAYDFYGEVVRKIMTPERAELVKKLRMTDEYSWRALAQECYEQWEGDKNNLWAPPSNQLAGMQLCKIAGEMLKETID